MSVSNASVQASDSDARREARKRERHAERQRLILQSARSLLVRQGIENFTIAQVAAVASVSKPAVYYYFNSKEDLVLALSMDVLVAERAVLEDVIDAEARAADAVAALVRARVDFYVNDRDSFRILHVWGPILGLQGRLEASPEHAALFGLIARIAGRFAMEPAGSRLSASVDANKLVELAWAMSQGIIAMTVLGPAGDAEQTRAIELRDGACRWLLDSLVG